jgi:hypothetical protein
MPTFTQDGVLVHYAAFKNHIGLYPPVSGDAELEAALAPCAGEKGNLRFPLDRPIPYCGPTAHRAAFTDNASRGISLYGLACPMEQAFIDSPHGPVAPDARIYFSDRAQGRLLHVAPEGRWIMDGVYRMTRTAHLGDRP